MKTNKYPFLADLALDNLIKEKLSLQLDYIVRGNDQVLLTPLGMSMKPDVVLREFDEIFNLPSNLSLLNNEILDLELQNKSKYGPRSIAKPWSERRDSVFEYFGEGTIGPDLNTNPPVSKDMFKLRPISRIEAVRLLKNSTNSCLPFLTRKGDVKEFYISGSEESYRLYPCVLFTRTQEGGKTRNVWGVCMSAIINENRFYRPLLGYQRKQSWRSALVGPDDVDRRLTETVDSAIVRDAYLLSNDLRSYDATAKKNLHNNAKAYVKGLFQPSYHNEIDSVVDFFTNCGLVTPDGILTGAHGVPSGSVFTNEFDSIIQYQVLTNSKYVFRENVQIQGDDSVCSVNKDNVEYVFKTYSDQGLIINRDKSSVSPRSCNYLQKYYSPDYRLNNGVIGGIYPVYRALLRLVYQERWTDFEDFGIIGKDYYSIRAITIMENCKHHPLFRELVKFVYSRDKYSLKYSQDGLNKYVSMLKEATGTGDVINNQYGDNIRGISNFETVKIIKELA